MCKVPPLLASNLHEMSTRDNTDLTTITCGILIDPYDEPSPSQPSRSTIWRHARSKPTRATRPLAQQYLTPSEEKAVVEYALRMYERGIPIPVKFSRYYSAYHQASAFLHLPIPRGRRWYPSTEQELAARLLQASP
jgi:hypothetical protein